MSETNRYWIGLGSAIVIVLGTGLYSAGFGLGTDTDSAAILRVLPEIADGHYVRSRTFGFPLYEIAASFAYGAWGLVGVNLLSTFFATGAACLLALIPSRRERNSISAIILAGILLSPVFLSNNSVLMETATGHFFFAMTLLFATSCLGNRLRGCLLGLTIANTLLLLTRPDYAIYTLPLYLVLAWSFRKDRDRLLWLISSGVLSACLVLSSYWILNDGLHFLNIAVLGHEPWLRRVAVGILAIYTIVGPLGTLASLYMLTSWSREMADTASTKSQSARFLRNYFIIAAPIAGLRFLALPDELEYIFPLFILGALTLAESPKPRPLLLILLALSSMSGSILQVSLFERKLMASQLRVRPAIMPGALIQEWNGRRLEQGLDSEEFKRFLANSALDGVAKPGSVELSRVPYLGGYRSSSGDLIIDAANHYVIDNPRFPIPEYQSAEYRRIYICEEPISLRRGWRILQPATSSIALERMAADEKLHCRLIEGSLH